MTYDEAEKVRQMIDGHWNLRMLEGTADLWLSALVKRDAELATKTVAQLAKTMHMPPKISDFEEVYVMLEGRASLPPAESCPTCGGDRFVLVALRPPVRSQWMVDKGIDLPARGGMEECAPCPDCNADANTSFVRYDNSVFMGPDPAFVRQRMAPMVHTSASRGAQKLPADVSTFLRDMHGGTPAGLDLADAGICEECGRKGKRYHYGKLTLCERCSTRRQKATEQLMGDNELVAILQETAS